MKSFNEYISRRFPPQNQYQDLAARLTRNHRPTDKTTQNAASASKYVVEAFLQAPYVHERGAPEVPRERDDDDEGEEVTVHFDVFFNLIKF